MIACMCWYKCIIPGRTCKEASSAVMCLEDKTEKEPYLSFSLKAIVYLLLLKSGMNNSKSLSSNVVVTFQIGQNIRTFWTRLPQFCPLSLSEEGLSVMTHSMSRNRDSSGAGVSGRMLA